MRAADSYGHHERVSASVVASPRNQILKQIQWPARMPRTAGLGRQFHLATTSPFRPAQRLSDGDLGGAWLQSARITDQFTTNLGRQEFESLRARGLFCAPQSAQRIGVANLASPLRCTSCRWFAGLMMSSRSKNDANSAEIPERRPYSIFAVGLKLRRVPDRDSRSDGQNCKQYFRQPLGQAQP